jgi:hypothetical protein
MTDPISNPPVSPEILKMVVTLTIEGSDRDVQRSHDALIRFVEAEETVRDDDFNISLDWHAARALPAKEETPDFMPHDDVLTADSPLRSSQPSSSSEITEAIDEMQTFAKILGRVEFCWERDDDVSTPDMEEAQKNVTAARLRLESLYREQLEALLNQLAGEREDFEYRLAAMLEGWTNTRAQLSSLKDSQLTDTARLDWLDTMGTFGVALNRHDGRQKTQDENGRPVILRLWLKDRGGENQSLREAIDALRPEVEK